MKIENAYTAYEMDKAASKISPLASTSGTPEAKPVQGKEPADNDAVVNLSNASREAQLIEKTVADTPDIREDKVMALKEKIEAGQYQVDAQATADKLVDHFTMDFLAP